MQVFDPSCTYCAVNNKKGRRKPCIAYNAKSGVSARWRRWFWRRWAAWGALRAAVPDTLYLEPGRPLTLASLPFLQAGRTGSGRRRTRGQHSHRRQPKHERCACSACCRSKTVRTVQAARRTVLVSGAPFGVKMLADGALIVAFSDQYTALGGREPGQGGRAAPGRSHRLGRRRAGARQRRPDRRRHSGRRSAADDRIPARRRAVHRHADPGGRPRHRAHGAQASGCGILPQGSAR